MRNNTRGLTIVELVLASLFGLLLIGAAAMSLGRDAQASSALIQEDVPTLSAQKAMETIAEEIGMASFIAEDRDGNGELGASEDLNVNGQLDSDWSLADGTTASTITFNRRFDLMFQSGARPSTAYSSKIRYSLQSGRIVRETKHSGTGQILRTSLASHVSDLRFTRIGGMVHIDIVIQLRDGQTRTLAKSVLVRE